MNDKQKKYIFVIMPFTATPSRSQDDLTEFYQTHLKQSIEEATDLKYQYVVRRSDNTFDITNKIIIDVFEADILLCDLSGENANPNVMYELGMRLSLSNKPVILFREKHPDNKRIFDIAGFHTFEYNPYQYSKLEQYIHEKLTKFETGEEVYESPILRALRRSPTIMYEIDKKRTSQLVLSLSYELAGMQDVLSAAVSYFLRKQSSSLELNVEDKDDMITLFRENRSELSELPWSSFVFQPGTMPVLNVFLVDFPLRDILPFKLEVAINTLIRKYFDLFLANTFSWYEPTFHIVFMFAGETWVLNHVINGCGILLTSPPSSEAEETISKMRKMIMNSNLIPKESFDSWMQDDSVSSTGNNG